MDNLTPQELANVISNFVNGASEDKLQELANLMSIDHPTLQQKTMKLVCMFIEKMAEKSRTDHRNEQSKKIAIRMIEGHKASVIKEIIDHEGSIPTRIETFIKEHGLPSKNLPLI